MLFNYGGTLPAHVMLQGVIPNGVDGFMVSTVMPDEFFRALMAADIVVYEDFEIDGTITGSWASETIGALKMHLFAMTRPAPVRQTRRDKATLFGQKAPTTEKRQTERFNWLRDRGFEGVSHELDAITHALVYIKRQGHKPTIDKYWRNFK